MDAYQELFIFDFCCDSTLLFTVSNVISHQYDTIELTQQKKKRKWQDIQYHG